MAYFRRGRSGARRAASSCFVVVAVVVVAAVAPGGRPGRELIYLNTSLATAILLQYDTYSVFSLIYWCNSL